MSKKVKCAECKYRVEWSVIGTVDESNIDYAERLLKAVKHTFTCEYSMKDKPREHEQYCRHFVRMEKDYKDFLDKHCKEKIENLEKAIKEFKEKQRREQPLPKPYRAEKKE